VFGLKERGFHLGSLKNYHKRWLLTRQSAHHKMIKVNYVKEYCEILDPYVELKDMHWEDHYCKYRYTGGYANFHLMRMSKGLYVDNFPKLGLYKESKTEDGIIDFFKNQDNDRYGQDEDIFTPDRNYSLFCLQMSRTKDYNNTVKALEWATKNKQYTIFRAHPCPGDYTYYKPLWDHFFKKGLLSEYTILVEGCRSEEMVKHADRVISSDSAVSFKAAIMGKPVIQMRDNNMMVDIVPTIPDLNGCLKVKPIPQEQLAQWLTWFYHCVCHDFHGTGYAEKLIRKLKFYEAGHTDEDLHSWKYLKNLGHI